MPKLTRLRLLINLLIVVFFSACATHNLVKDLPKTVVTNQSYQAVYFSNPTVDYVYKANISLYGHDLSGIFIAKKINETTHRVVFTTEFGNKLLDFEISETNLIVKSIVDELNKKIIINTLAHDFRMLLKEHYTINEQYQTDQQTILASFDKGITHFVFLSKNTHAMTQLVNATKRKQKINISFNTENNTFANKIVIQHYNLNLKIELNYLKKN